LAARDVASELDLAFEVHSQLGESHFADGALSGELSEGLFCLDNGLLESGVALWTAANEPLDETRLGLEALQESLCIGDVLVQPGELESGLLLMGPQSVQAVRRKLSDSEAFLCSTNIFRHVPYRPEWCRPITLRRLRLVGIELEGVVFVQREEPLGPIDPRGSRHRIEVSV
jgi:hypothetical protein